MSAEVATQRETIAQSERERAELRADVERLQQKVQSLTGERDRLLRGGAAEDAEAKHRELQARLETLRHQKLEIESGICQQEEELEAVRRAAAAAADAANDPWPKEWRKAEAHPDVQIREREARSQEAASQRVQDLESVNAQLEKRIDQVQADIAALRKVIVTQSEQLLRKVEDLTAEEKLAAEDRRHLLERAARLASEVERAEARIAQQSELEDGGAEAEIRQTILDCDDCGLQEQCAQLDAAQQTLSAEVERLRRTNDALCQQVLGSDGEGPFAGALQEAMGQNRRFLRESDSAEVSLLDGEEDQAMRDEIGRLVRGQLLITSQSGSVKGDAAALALRLQQLLAEREEAFWVERQRLSDHIASLERAQNGRTSNLLRQYDAAVRASGGSVGQAIGQMMRAAMLLYLLSSFATAGAAAAPTWMGDSFDHLKGKSLLKITLPGSHNSGNYVGGLHAHPLCESDYRYEEPSLIAETRHRPNCVSIGMIPWNINHFLPIKAQLLEGVRYLHLKICNFGKPGDLMDLAAVRFQHRGYTTHETVLSTLHDIRHFLHEHPKEVVLLAFNNLHNNASKVFDKADVNALVAAVEWELGEIMISRHDLFNKTLGELVDLNKRIAVFVKGARHASHAISELDLAENWAPAMASGNLTLAKDWLLRDLKSEATQHSRYYVMQANPNNAEPLMYEAMNSALGPQSNLRFLEPFLLDLQSLVIEAVRQEPQIQINVIDTDFLSISRPYQICMQLMGSPMATVPATAFVAARGGAERLAAPSVEHAPRSVSTRPRVQSQAATAAIAGSAFAILTSGRKKPGPARKGLRVVAARKAVPPGVYCEALEKCERRKTRTVYVGEVPVGSEHPIATQTMTTTLTTDVEATVSQVKKCADMGIDIVRLTVQGMKEAKACEHIKKRLLEDGYKTPLVADIHFTPKVALVCADFVDKVRVNPGNFADGRKSFDTIDELTEEDVKEAKDAIEEALTPLVQKLKEQNKSMRIGVNHGSLAERILFQYGDSPEGMVASAIEFGEICRKHDFHNFIFSMKSSNPQVMVNAYRQLAREMYKLGWDYPLHLGVTEAGGGSDGRIKSAVGIGALLLDGLGDTIRVSLTEDPEYEAKPCIALRGVAEGAVGKGVAPFEEHSQRRNGQFSRRKCEYPIDVPLNQDGSVLARMSVKELTSLDTAGLCDRLGLRLRADGDVQKDWKSVDAVVIEGMLPPGAGVKLKTLLDVPTGVLCKAGPNVPEGATVLMTADAVAAGDKLPERLGGYAVVFTGEESQDEMQDVLEKASPRFILLKPANRHGRTFLARRFFAQLGQLEVGKSVPTMLWFHYAKEDNKDQDDVVVEASADFGSLFVDGMGEGLLWDAEDLSSDELRESSFNLLQASRMRISKTEFISCPSCGRTLFDLQETTAKIQARTGHLPGVRIAVMGCIVNGPGEMADADFGYVGSGVGKVDLYVNYDVVKRAIPSAEAVEALVDLIKEHGRWSDPVEAEDVEAEVGAVAVL
eukprot:s3795_g1.t3